MVSTHSIACCSTGTRVSLVRSWLLGCRWMCGCLHGILSCMCVCMYVCMYMYVKKCKRWLNEQYKHAFV